MSDKTEAEKIAPELLLRRGVKVKVGAPLFLRLFGKKTQNLIMHMPCSYTLLEIADRYLSVDWEKEKELSLTDTLVHYRKHARVVHDIVTIGLLNGRQRWRRRFLRRRLQKELTEGHWLYLYQLLVKHGGVEDFLNTISLIGKTKITNPMNLSRKKGS